MCIWISTLSSALRMSKIRLPCAFVCTRYPTYSCTMIPCILLAPTWPLIPLFDSSCCASLCLACTRRRVESRGQVQSNGFQVQGHRDTGVWLCCLVGFWAGVPFPLLPEFIVFLCVRFACTLPGCVFRQWCNKKNPGQVLYSWTATGQVLDPWTTSGQVWTCLDRFR